MQSNIDCGLPQWQSAGRVVFSLWCVTIHAYQANGWRTNHDSEYAETIGNERRRAHARKMDLAKVKDDEKLRLCRWYYRGGFFILPFLWFVNAVWFFKEAFVRPPFDEQKTIRGYVIKSGIGATVWFVALVVWVVFFQLKRAEWGATGDYLSFITPTGIP